MTLTTPRHGFNRRIYVPQAKEAAYGDGDQNTATATFDFVFNMRRNEGTPVRPAILTTDDRELATGYEGPHRQIHLGADLPPVSLGMPLTIEGLGWALAFAMGNDTVSGTVSYTHALTMAALSAGYPGSFGLEEHLGGATVDTSTDYNLKGCVIDEVTVSGSRTGFCQLDFTVSGNGDVGTPDTAVESGYVTPGYTAKSAYFMGESVRVGVKAQSVEQNPEGFSFATSSTVNDWPNFDAISSETDLSSALESWSVTYRNIWGRRRSSGIASSSGLIGACPIWTAREVIWELTFLQSAGFDALTKALASGTNADNVEYAIFVEGTSDVDVTSDASAEYANFFLVSALAQIEGTPGGSFGELNTDTITLRGKEPLTSDGQGMFKAWTHDSISGVYNQ